MRSKKLSESKVLLHGIPESMRFLDRLRDSKMHGLLAADARARAKGNTD